MSIESKIARLEEWWRPATWPRSVEAATDAELEAVICEALNCSPAELTDELLGQIARGE